MKRASRQKIAWFRKKLGPPIEGRMRAGYTVCVQDEAICVADARLRKGVYTPKGVRGVYTYTRSHSKTIVFGLSTLDGEGFFQRYGSSTGKEFVEFLKAACERFGKILMTTDGAPQHRSKFVREEIGRLDGVELQFLPPGCPDLNAIEEAWRQMKHAALDVPYVRFSSMCSDIEEEIRQSCLRACIKSGGCSRNYTRRCRYSLMMPLSGGSAWTCCFWEDPEGPLGLLRHTGVAICVPIWQIA